MDTLDNNKIPLVVTRKALFLCFLYMGLVSFGGVLPCARRALVEERNWLTGDEFADALSLGQILPGPNVVNLSIMVGARFHGAIGALLAFSGLMLAPLAAAALMGAFGFA
jgi:chromate transporter